MKRVGGWAASLRINILKSRRKVVKEAGEEVL